MSQGIHPDLLAKSKENPDLACKVVVTYTENSWDCLEGYLNDHAIHVFEHLEMLGVVIIELTAQQMVSLVAQCKDLMIDDADKQFHAK